MTDNLELTALDDAELASIAGGLGPLMLVAVTALIAAAAKDFVDHVGDFGKGLKDGWTVATR